MLLNVFGSSTIQIQASDETLLASHSIDREHFNFLLQTIEINTVLSILFKFKYWNLFWGM